jgi:hypothetical protein
MKLSIVHDDQGSIVSVTHVNPSATQGVSVVPEPGHSVIDLELGEEHKGKSLLDLHQHYRIDKAAKKLVAKK